MYTIGVFHCIFLFRLCSIYCDFIHLCVVIQHLLCSVKLPNLVGFHLVFRSSEKDGASNRVI